jgi:alkylation response protein AidB-like acyl-CoA dehydrogenase
MPADARGAADLGLGGLARPGDGTAPRSVITQLEHVFRDEFAEQTPDWEKAGRIPPAAFARLGRTGAFEARWSAARGGLGDVDVAATLARESALLSLGATIGIAAHCDGFLLAVRRAACADTLYSEALAGRQIGCVAISEPTSGSDVTHCATRAVRHGARWVLDGRKHYVSNVLTATECVVFARTGTAGNLTDFTLFLVPTQAPGVRSTPHDLVGTRASGTCMVDFAEVEVDADRVVGEIGSGLSQLVEILRLERLWAALGCAAIARLCVEIALAFTTRRWVGGKPLRQHQAIAHRLADMDTLAHAAEVVAERVLEAARHGALTTSIAARGKLFASRTACACADEAVQLLGGAGYTEATPMARIWRDVRLTRIGGGTDEVLRELLVRSLRRGPLAGLPSVRSAVDAAQAGDAAARGVER